MTDISTPAAPDTTQPQAKRRVWDLPTRLFHWTLVLAFAGAYITNRAGIEYFTLHLWCGYTVLGLVSFRVIWGFIGTRNAQFIHFIRGPITTARYGIGLLRGRHPVHTGHNPLGAVMVIALLLSLFIQAATGLFTNDEISNTGPLVGWVSEDFSLELTGWHRWLFWWILYAVGLHILAVLAHWVFARENLIKAMFTGSKPAERVAADEAIGSSRLWLALIVASAVSGAIYWVVKSAPAAF